MITQISQLPHHIITKYEGLPFDSEMFYGHLWVSAEVLSQRCHEAGHFPGKKSNNNIKTCVDHFHSHDYTLFLSSP